MRSAFISIWLCLTLQAQSPTQINIKDIVPGSCVPLAPQPVVFTCWPVNNGMAYQCGCAILVGAKLTPPTGPAPALGGTPGIFTVTPTGGSGLPPMAGHVGQSLLTDGVNALWQALALTGDVQGTLGVNAVLAIQGKPVSPNAPQEGQALIWNATTGRWEPQALPASSPTATPSTVRGECYAANASGSYPLALAAGTSLVSGSLYVHENGQQWEAGQDYGLTGTTVTIINPARFQPGDGRICFDYKTNP